MRTLFVAQALQRGGAERQLVTLARGLSQRGDDVSVVVFYGGGPLEPELREAGVIVVDLAKRSRWNVVGPLVNLVRQVRRVGPDIVHSYLVVPNLVVALLKPFFAGSRIVWGVRQSSLDYSYYDSFARFTLLATSLVARLADAIIVNSQAGLRYHLQLLYPSNRMVVVANGVDTDHYRPKTAGRDAVRAEWGVSSDELLVGMVARLDPMKDHRTFVEAAALVSKRRPNSRFVCVGMASSAARAPLEALAEERGIRERLLWAGPRSDMPEVYSALDVMCLSSSMGEGFPNAVAEAMSCGIPCLVTDVGDAADVVGDTGVVVDRGSPGQLADGMCSLMERLRGDRAIAALAARNRVVSCFSAETLVSRTADILSVCAMKRPPRRRRTRVRH